MISLFRLISFCLVLFCFRISLAQSNIQNRFVLDGQINMPSGKVCLVPTVPSKYVGGLLITNSLTSEIKNGKFEIKGLLDYPYAFNLEVYSNDSIMYKSDFFVIEKGFQKVFFDIDKPTATPILTNETMRLYKETPGYNEFNRIKKDMKWFQAFSDSVNKYSSPVSDSLKNVIASMEIILAERKKSYIHNTCFSETNSFYSFWLLYSEFVASGIKPGYAYFYSNFSDEIKETEAGQALQVRLNEANIVGLNKIFPLNHVLWNLKTEKTEEIEIGKKYTLIDFWHSSCGICIKQLIEYKEMYPKYSALGFEIVSIAGERSDMLGYLNKLRNKNNFPWTEYLDKDRKVTASEFNIAIFPTNFLLDSTGKIIRKDISLPDLALFLDGNLR